MRYLERRLWTVLVLMVLGPGSAPAQAPAELLPAEGAAGGRLVPLEPAAAGGAGPAAGPLSPPRLGFEAAADPAPCRPRIAFAAVGADGEEVPGRPLLLRDVIASIEESYPALLAAEQEREVAAGRALATREDLRRLPPPTPPGGAAEQDHAVRLTGAAPVADPAGGAGYRLTTPGYPVEFDSRRRYPETREMVLPLLQKQALLEQQAAVRRAEIEQLLTDPHLQRVRVEALRNAAHAYWRWVTAGRKYRLARVWLDAARGRSKSVEALAGAGEINLSEVVVNDRVVAERQARLVAAERDFDRAAIQLSLYYRDRLGRPEKVDLGRVPVDFPETVAPAPEFTDRDVEAAWRRRPELLRIRLLQERTRGDLQRAGDPAEPHLYVLLRPDEQPAGKAPAVSRYTYRASLFLDDFGGEGPSEGRKLCADARLAQLDAEAQLQMDRIRVEVEEAVSALDRAHALVQKLIENVDIAATVREDELARFEAGGGHVALLHLHESAAFEAESSLIDALGDYFTAYADYRAALGLDATPEGEGAAADAE